MKKAALALCTVVAIAGAAFGGLISEDPGELTVAGQYWFPGGGDYDLFKAGYGATVSYREWFSFPWGVGVNLGVAQWQADDGSNAFKYDKLSDYDGEALLIPLGASLYFNMIDWENWNFILNTGLQYLFVDSGIDLYNGEDQAMRRQDVDIGGSLLWNFGAEYDYMITENAFVLAGLGYQLGLVDADAEYNGVSVRDTSFQGFFVQLGAKFLF